MDNRTRFCAVLVVILALGMSYEITSIAVYGASMVERPAGQKPFIGKNLATPPINQELTNSTESNSTDAFGKQFLEQREAQDLALSSNIQKGRDNSSNGTIQNMRP